MNTAMIRRRAYGGPADLMRAILMDFGFAGLIEKIEEYCGKHVTRALMWVLVFAAFALTLRLGVESLVAVSGMIARDDKDWWSVADDILILAAATAFLCAIVSVAIAKYVKRKARMELASLVSDAKSLHEHTGQLLVDWEQRDLESQRKFGELEQKLYDAEREVKRRIVEEAKRQGIFPKQSRGNPDA